MPSTAVALARSTHPGPTIAVTTITVLLGVGVGLDPARVLLVGLAMLANQASVGLSNDWLDAERDRMVERTDKPIARGWVSVGTVRAAAWGCAAVSLVLTAPLGIGAFAAQLVFIVSAWAYNMGLKGTLFSVVPYLVSFGLLPVIVTQSLPVPSGAAWWAITVGALLGVAAHFANVLPDLDDDHRTGIRGLPHRLGRVAAGVTTYLVLAAASVILVVGSATSPLAGGIVLTLNGGVVVAGITLVLTRPPSRVLFQLIIVAALITVTLLVIAGDRVPV